ncbi:MAG: hypothetical protein Q7R89_00615 [bacterium]|nr:hypothetical protein [bacterium]
MENFEASQYRKNLAEEIKQEPDKEKRREILEQAKTTEEYQETRRLKLEKVNGLVEDQEKLSALREQLGVEQATSEITTTRRAAEELGNLQIDRQEYSLEDAKREKPLMHYSKAGNIFQILRFGIQSNNFKNRFDALRKDNPESEKLAQQMCGLRIKQGGSYQEVDSISLSRYSEQLHTPPGNVLYFINPNIKTFGGRDEERDPTSGYGHGIKSQVVAEEYKVGNPTAYRDEILGANAIMPKELKAIVIDKFTSIISDMSRVAQENAKVFMQEKLRNPRASEDLVATAKLLAELAGNDSITSEAQELEKQLATMSYQEICTKLIAIQKKALAEFVGADKKLDEESVRQAIESRFGIQFIKKE